MEVMISRKELRLLLENGKKVIGANPSGVRKAVDVNDLISLTVDARRKRCGGEVHPVVPPNSASVSPRHPKSSLVKAIARAHGWYESVIQGKALNMRSLARHAGLTERYVGKVFGCAFLAPDIIESILEGRQPHDLNFEKLCQQIPLSWVEQRSQFGLPPAPSQRQSKSFLQ